MPAFSSYILCGTPRSGSTLLCEMLVSSGVAGQPNSYFRAPDYAYWAERWGVAVPNGTDDVGFDRRYLRAMLDFGSNGTGLFGLRLMWRSVGEAVRRLQRLQGGEADFVSQARKAFGETLYVHLSRGDKLGQAISLIRAEQSGLWHLNADGSVYEGNQQQAAVVYDADRITSVIAELEGDDAAWNAFFDEEGVEPLRLTYEAVSADPQAALAGMLAALGCDTSVAATLPVPTRKMADETSRAWRERFLAERAPRPGA